ncbi:AEC family transporter [Klebsiella pneumoniae]|uniref:AEC family transporter n=1 Tax=Klebsiella pneumoniae TaxID=573 RepID=UPI000B41FBE7|nr:AEC family transporter [Klebsiella pneumoniae]MBX4658171.1 AEC family transporter [Klebsiella pneumoniae]MCU6533035.1 AEC family transporter [Klebsiella pneumoniae]MDM7344405.1 AEC family transporter [Klebsiella pneumoniae]MDT3772501.1 AEC family transporter [Klebsiella pneumoniae]MDZ5975329.1 AEC family transporter [Klebsiella pneumoniae]
MTYVIIHALAPIFVIMLLGFWAGKAGMVDNKNVSLLNIFVMDFALPATLFSATVQTPWAGIVAQSPLVLVLTGAMWITYAALGLPILGSVLGEGASTSLSVAVSIACGSVLMTPFCLLILEREKARAVGENSGSTLAMLPVLMWRSVKKPIVWGPLLGVVLSAIGIKMPDLLLASIKPLGLAATAAALFLTGVILSARKLQLNALIATSTIVKLLVQPFIAWGLVMLLGLHGSIAITAILMIALAAGFFGVVFGNRFGVQSPDAEAVLLLSSVLCILSLPLFISLTSGL